MSGQTRAPLVVLVVARADNGVIGRDGGLPWRIPADLARFKRLTMGTPMIMGRKTWESIGRPLPGRQSIVVTRQPGYAAPGARVVADLEAAFAIAGRIAGESGADRISVVGGAEIYRQALAAADRIELTEVHADVEGETSLQPFDPRRWTETARERHSSEAADGADYSFVTLVRQTA